MLFAQRRNLVSPRFLRMVYDILRFNRESVADLEAGRLSDDMTLGEYLERHGYSAGFRRDYLVAMGSAIWSSDCASMLDFPLQFFVRFFKNHGLLSVRHRPQWRVIEGGSREYIGPCAGASRGASTREHPFAGCDATPPGSSSRSPTAVNSASTRW
jgi:predicted NAD/FAD-binding protein